MDYPPSSNRRNGHVFPDLYPDPDTGPDLKPSQGTSNQGQSLNNSPNQSPDLSNDAEFENCLACKGRISIRALACPHCGAPNGPKWLNMVHDLGLFWSQFAYVIASTTSQSRSTRPEHEPTKSD